VAERTGDFEWHAEGEEAEAILYAPDEEASERALRIALPATSLPGVNGPVFAAASTGSAGRVALSATHAAPGLVSVPGRGMLLVADRRLGETDAPFEQLSDLVGRGLADALPALPSVGEAGVRRFCEEGARAAAEDGLIEEEDLQFLTPVAGDPDALGRRALAAGVRDWKAGIRPTVGFVEEVLDRDSAEALGLDEGVLVVVLDPGGGELGRLAREAHRERITRRVWAGADFGATRELPAAPLDTGEAEDLLVALGAASNFADGCAAAALAALRRSYRGFGGLAVRAAWRVGGLERAEGGLIHREGLGARANGEAMVSGSSVVAGAGKMLRSVPPFDASGGEGPWIWEEAGLVERLASLGGTGG
jgi:tRNA-splicing ligase RtcB (3'-phosphate/5'-hydroxy nucleic acid ligase)